MQKLYKNFLFFHLILGFNLITSFGNAQELVVNGGFESYSNLPTGEAQWWHINSWNNVNMQAVANASYASPDYYNEDANQLSGYSLPISQRGYIEPHTGKAIVGLLCFNQVGSAYLNFREYLSNQLASPMVVGETYTVSFWMSNAEDPPITATHPRRRYGSSAKGMGIYFSTSPLSQPTRDIISVTPQIEVVGVPWSADWTLYSYTYVATSAWQYITIGNFTPTALQLRTVMDATAQYSTGSYYFIDDVSIVPASILPIELASFDATYESDKVILNWATTSELNNDYFTIERSLDAISWEELKSVEGAGNSSSVLNYSDFDENPYSGVSYYRLKYTDFEGKFNYSDLRTVEVKKGGFSQVNIYPNPSEAVIKIIGDADEIAEIKIYSLLGEDLTAFTTEISNLGSMVVLDLSKLSAGVYWVRTRNTTTKLHKQ